jgi:hypothetical protein
MTSMNLAYNKKGPNTPETIIKLVIGEEYVQDL